jgi:hypothetical protein
MVATENREPVDRRLTSAAALCTLLGGVAVLAAGVVNDGVGWWMPLALAPVWAALMAVSAWLFVGLRRDATGKQGGLAETAP